MRSYLRYRVAGGTYFLTLVSRVRDHAWSLFHRYVRLGHYEPNWGGTNPVPGWEYPE